MDPGLWGDHAVAIEFGQEAISYVRQGATSKIKWNCLSDQMLLSFVDEVTDPNKEKDLYLSALAHFQAENYEKAYRGFSTLVDGHPDQKERYGTYAVFSDVLYRFQFGPLLQSQLMDVVTFHKDGQQQKALSLFRQIQSDISDSEWKQHHFGERMDTIFNELTRG